MNIQYAIRAEIRSDDWAWRSGPLPTDPIRAAAWQRLRDEQARACHWLEAAADAIGLPLPTGNGIGGPWHRAAVIDGSGCFGLLDIAHGAIAWTDAIVPAYVRRFGLRTRRGTSPNPAGGGGGMGSAVAQIALTYGMRGMPRPRISPRPRPTVTWIEAGLETCYGSVGSVPPAGMWPAGEAPAVAVRETETPQRQTVTLGVGELHELHVPRASWEVYQRAQPYGSLREVSLGRDGDGGACGCRVRVTGLRPERERVIAHIRATWPSFARERAMDAAIESLRAHGLAVPCLQGPPLDQVYARRRIAASIAPDTGLTPEQQAHVTRVAAETLARDPREVGLSYRDPWGRPGYAPGGNHIGYVVADPLAEHVYHQPGVADWLKATREAADAERRRIAAFGPLGYGQVTAGECDALREAGYTVVPTRFGSVEAVR